MGDFIPFAQGGKSFSSAFKEHQNVPSPSIPGKFTCLKRSARTLKQMDLAGKNLPGKIY